MAILKLLGASKIENFKRLSNVEIPKTITNVMQVPKGFQIVKGDIVKRCYKIAAIESKAITEMSY